MPLLWPEAIDFQLRSILKIVILCMLAKIIFYQNVRLETFHYLGCAISHCQALAQKHEDINRICNSSPYTGRISMYKFTRISLTTIVVAATIGGAIADDDTHARRAVKESLQSSGHASGSAAHSIAASGQVTSGVLAVPLSVGGAVLSTAGAVSISAASDLRRAATAPIGTPLKITDEVISSIPPDEALKAKKQGNVPY